MIYEEIKSRKIQARKTRNQQEVEFYTFLQGELERSDKSPSDEKSIKVLRKILSSLKEFNDVSPSTRLLWEINTMESILETLAPKQLTYAEILNIIKYNVPGASLGEVQKYFKQNFPGQYEGGIVSLIYKEVN